MHVVLSGQLPVCKGCDCVIEVKGRFCDLYITVPFVKLQTVWAINPHLSFWDRMGCEQFYCSLQVG